MSNGITGRFKRNRKFIEDEIEVAPKRSETTVHYAAYQNEDDQILTLCIQRLCYLNIESYDDALQFIHKNALDHILCLTVQQAIAYISNKFQNRRWEIDDCFRIHLER